jgi:hypothetical protein
LYCFPGDIGWLHQIKMDGTRNVHRRIRMSEGPDGKSPIGRQGRSWKRNVKMKGGERDCEDVKLYVV